MNESSRILKSFKHAKDGLIHALKFERNFRIQVYVGILVVALSIILSISTNNFLVILFVTCLLLSMELINSAIERLCNIITTKHHPEIKIIKDMAAATVLVMVLLSLAIGIIIFLPYIYTFFSKINI